MRIVSTVVGIFLLLLAVTVPRDAHGAEPPAGSVTGTVQVLSVISVDGAGNVTTNASERPLTVTFPATFNGVEYLITMVS